MQFKAGILALLLTVSGHPLPDIEDSSLASILAQDSPKISNEIPVDSCEEKSTDSFRFDYENEKIRGVNLGGWFILEPFITPSFFSDGWNQSSIPQDEYHFTKLLGKDKARPILEKHWDEWIQEEDFAKLATQGINFVRIPIGYWAFIDRPGEPYVQGQVKYFERAIGWAQKHGIKLWIDLHGVPGSQNSLDNSGQAGVAQWMDRNTTNLHDTYLTLQAIIDRYGGPELQDTVIGIEPVNEPLPKVIDITDIREYYNESYKMIREKSENLPAIMHDAFEPLGYMNSWFEKTNGYHDVVIDHHLYQWTTYSYLNMTTQDHIDEACSAGRTMKNNETLPRIVGEWSAAMTDCQKNLRGIGQGAMYDGSFDESIGAPFGLTDTAENKPLGSCSFSEDITKWTDERKENTRKFVEAQLDAYEYGGSGWVSWTYKTETSIEWDFSRLTEYGLFPNPVTERKYKNQCGF